MLKTIFTLVRGATFRAEEEFADRSALLILDQQIRDAAAGIERAKRALAVAIAQDEAEGKRLETTLARIADLEERAVAALNGGSEELAAEAAEAIAVMEADRDAIREARATFAREIARAEGDRAQVRPAAGRTRARPAHRAGGRSRCGGSRPAPALPARRRDRLADAEATLRRLRERQAEDAAADERLRDARHRGRTRPASRTSSKPQASASAPARPPRACSSA